MYSLSQVITLIFYYSNAGDLIIVPAAYRSMCFSAIADRSTIGKKSTVYFDIASGLCHWLSIEAEQIYVISKNTSSFTFPQSQNSCGICGFDQFMPWLQLARICDAGQLCKKYKIGLISLSV